MTGAVVIERELRHPPEKVWRALTQPALIAEWLMASDFAPVLRHSFRFRTEPMPHWDGIVDSEVIEIDPPHRLSYRWDTSAGLLTVVSWNLEATAAGTLLRLEHTGFGPDDHANLRGATYGWNKNVAALEAVVERLS